MKRRLLSILFNIFSEILVFDITLIKIKVINEIKVVCYLFCRNCFLCNNHNELSKGESDSQLKWFRGQKWRRELTTDRIVKNNVIKVWLKSNYVIPQIAHKSDIHFHSNGELFLAKIVLIFTSFSHSFP